MENHHWKRIWLKLKIISSFLCAHFPPPVFFLAISSLHRYNVNYQKKYRTWKPSERQEKRSEMEDRCMIKLYDTGAYLVNGTELVEDSGDAKLILRNMLGKDTLSGKRQRKIPLPIVFWKITIHPEIWKNWRSSLINWLLMILLM